MFHSVQIQPQNEEFTNLLLTYILGFSQRHLKISALQMLGLYSVWTFSIENSHASHNKISCLYCKQEKNFILYIKKICSLGSLNTKPSPASLNQHILDCSFSLERQLSCIDFISYVMGLTNELRFYYAQLLTKTELNSLNLLRVLLSQ